MQLRTTVLTGLGALAACGAIAVPVVAQSGSPSKLVVEKVQVSPNVAGTKKKPRAVKLTVAGRIETPAGQERPIVQRVEVLFPKGSLYNGGKYPKCSQAVLDTGSMARCPKGSIMGKGLAKAWADTVRTTAKMTIINGGSNRAYAFTEMNRPAVVRAPVVGVVKKMSGKWAYRLTLTVPDSLQVVGGVPIAVEHIAVTGGSTKKPWIATTSCPKNKKWPFQVTTFHSDGTKSSVKSFTKCR